MNRAIFIRSKKKSEINTYRITCQSTTSIQFKMQQCTKERMIQKKCSKSESNEAIFLEKKRRTKLLYHGMTAVKNAFFYKYAYVLMVLRIFRYYA